MTNDKALRGRKETTMLKFSVGFDKYDLSDVQRGELSEMVKARLAQAFYGIIASQPCYKPTQNDLPVLMSLDESLTFLQGQHVYSDDDDLVRYDLSPADEPGSWLGWRIETVNVSCYLTKANEVRGFDIQVIVYPTHDSHARFALAPVMITARLGLESQNSLVTGEQVVA